MSFLDLLSGALGAVIFLFIVVPKGDGESPSVEPQLAVSYDTVRGQFFGEIPDSLFHKAVGDSLLAVLIDFKEMPGLEERPERRPTPPPPKPADKPVAAEKSTPAPSSEKLAEKPVERIVTRPVASPEIKPVSSSGSSHTKVPTHNYKGPMPSVPCSFSVELKWEDPKDNVDLFLCKDGDCVFGARRYRENIGFWDSGKSRTSIFGGDLRTSQEAVRQFDDIIPGEYVILAQYKASPEPQNQLPIEGLVYTNASGKGEAGERFSFSLPLNERERTRIGTVKVEADGSYNFQLTINN